jgi:hypothetical protein
VSSPTLHTGRPVLRERSDGGVLVLCPHGHVVHSMKPADWAGSWLEAKVSDPDWIVECDGVIACPHA